MEEKIKTLVQDRKPQEVEELNLDNVRASEFSGLGEEFSGLKQLSVINVGLTTLDGLPHLPTLERLELGDNKLTGGLERLSNCPALVHVSLVGNRIRSVEDLEPLRSLKSLASLDLLDCPVTQNQGYREQVFELLPSLTALDGLNKEGEEVEESDSEEEEEEGGYEEDSDNEPGLEYLQRELGSDSSGASPDYDPDADEPEGDDDVIPSSDEGSPGEAGPSSKKPRLDPQPNNSDSD